MHRKLLIASSAFTLFLLTACAETSNTTWTEVIETTVVRESTTTNSTEEQQPDQESVKSSLKEVQEKEFDSKFTKDPEEKQYENGKYQLADGTILNANKFVYSDDEWFDYMTAIYYEGKLSHLQVESTKQSEEVVQGIGLSKENYNEIKPSKFEGVFEVIIDERFVDENIAVLPNEWD